MYKYLKEKMDVSKQLGNLNTEMETIRKETNVNSRTDKCNI